MLKGDEAGEREERRKEKGVERETERGARSTKKPGDRRRCRLNETPRRRERKSQRSRENGRQECEAKPGQREPGVLETDAAKEATEGKGRLCPLLNLAGAKRALLGGPYLDSRSQEGLLRRGCPKAQTGVPGLDPGSFVDQGTEGMCGKSWRRSVNL